ncbi:hypothetical protein OROGR_022119 [Orobanche gracilis]
MAGLRMLNAHILLLYLIENVRTHFIEHGGDCNILVMPREDYKLSFHLYNGGNTNIVSLVQNDDLLREMILKCVLERANQKPPMYWRPRPKEEMAPVAPPVRAEPVERTLLALWGVWCLSYGSLPS